MRYNYTDEYIDSKSVRWVFDKYSYLLKKRVEENKDRWRQFAFVAYHFSGAETFGEFLNGWGLGYEEEKYTIKDVEKVVSDALEVLKRREKRGEL